MQVKRWIKIGWTAWLVFIFAVAARPFLWHLNVFHTVDERLYRLLLVVLPVAVLGGWAYHYLRRLGFWRYEPIVLPAAVLLLLGLYSPLAVAVTLWIVLAAFVTGRQITDWFGLSPDLGVSTLAGLGLFSCALFVIGISGEFRAWIFAGLFALPLVALVKNLAELRLELRSMRTAWIEDPETIAPHVSLAIFASIVLALFTAAAVLAPAWEGDAIRSHLALARAYLLQHSIAVPAALNYGYYPQGYEVLASAAYALGGQTAAQAINPVFFCLALLLVYKVARCCGIERSWAAAGAVMGVAIPYLHEAGSVIKNDLAVAAFQLAAGLGYLRWRQTRNFRWILGSAFFLAMSFDVKLVALFGAIPLALAYAHAIWRQPRRLPAALSVAAVLLVFGVFWQTRTYLATGSPLYPASTAIASPPNYARSRGGTRFWRFMNRPYEVHVDGKRLHYPTPNPMGILLPLLAPLWLIRPQGVHARRTETVLWLFLLVYYVYWCLAGAVPRYAIVPVLLLAVLGVSRLALFPRWLSVAAMAGAMLFALPVMIILEMAPAEIPLLLKQIDVAEFLGRTLPPYRAVEFLAKRAALTDHIASVGDWAVAYAPNPASFLHFYRDDRHYKPADVSKILEESRGGYLILPNSANLAELEAAARQHYHLERLYQDRDFVVYALAP
jgi:hypothetical protein